MMILTMDHGCDDGDDCDVKGMMISTMLHIGGEWKKCLGEL